MSFYQLPDSMFRLDDVMAIHRYMANDKFMLRVDNKTVSL